MTWHLWVEFTTRDVHHVEFTGSEMLLRGLVRELRWRSDVHNFAVYRTRGTAVTTKIGQQYHVLNR